MLRPCLNACESVQATQVNLGAELLESSMLVDCRAAALTADLTRPSAAEPPEIVPFAMEAPLSVGQDATLLCSVYKGDTPLTLTWSVNGEPVAGRPGVQVLPAGVRSTLLTVPSVSAEHSGIYTCTASNAAGTVSHSTRLDVRGQLVLSLSPLTRCEAFSLPLLGVSRIADITSSLQSQNLFLDFLACASPSRASSMFLLLTQSNAIFFVYGG